ncbi:hypothetical protein ABIE77_004857 [Sinorhizobium fredii]
MAAVLERLDPGLEILVVRVRIDVREDGTPKSAGVQNIECALRDRHRRKPAVGDQQRLLHAGGLAMVGKLLDAASPELDGGRVAPVGGDRHAVTFFRW